LYVVSHLRTHHRCKGPHMPGLCPSTCLMRIRSLAHQRVTAQARVRVRRRVRVIKVHCNVSCDAVSCLWITKHVWLIQTCATATVSSYYPHQGDTTHTLSQLEPEDMTQKLTKTLLNMKKNGLVMSLLRAKLQAPHPNVLWPLQRR